MIGIVIGVSNLFIWPHSTKPSRLKITLYSFLALFISAIWTWFLCAFIIDLLDIIGFITELSSAYLGVTWLSMGNSVGDFIADLSIANLSFVDMAVTGTYSCPTFNMMLGFALTIVISSLKSEYFFK